MSVTVAIVCLAVCSSGLRAAGLYLPQNELLSRLAAPLTAAVLASLIVGTATNSTTLSLDSRLIGLAAALIAIAAKKTLFTVLLISVASTAAARLVL